VKTVEIKERNRIKDETLQLRLSSNQKELIERAAALTGLSISSFMLSHSIKAAEHEVVTRERISLSKRDWDLFMEAIENPPSPNAALKRAAQTFHKKYSR